MNRRSRAREVALQLLFQHDHNTTVARAVVEQFVRDRIKEAGAEQFCLQLYDGVLAQQTTIDQQLSAAAENWRLVRMATVDRNVLRMGAFEVLSMQATPAAVAIDEAIELVRRYGSKDSPSFVNGVLDRLRRTAQAAT